MENYTCSFPNGVGVLNQYFSPAEEAQLYLNTGLGFFSILLDKGEDKKQTSYPLESLPMVLDALQGYYGNVWISQAAFRCPNRRQANFSRIGLCFLDIDAYSKPWSRDCLLRRWPRRLLVPVSLREFPFLRISSFPDEDCSRNGF